MYSDERGLQKFLIDNWLWNKFTKYEKYHPKTENNSLFLDDKTLIEMIPKEFYKERMPLYTEDFDTEIYSVIQQSNSE